MGLVWALPCHGALGFRLSQSRHESSKLPLLFLTLWFWPSLPLPLLLLLPTPLEKGTQVGFWLPIKIPAEYVIMMPGLPENAKSKIFHGGTLNNKFQE